MTKIKTKYTNDPFSLKVLPESIMVPIDKIKVSHDFEHDEIFFRKYKNYLLGKSNVYYTRISINNILPGFYKRVGNHWKHIKISCKKYNIQALISKIRNGYRPPLHLYYNLNKESKYPFVCSDDQVAYYAYKILKISSPPVILLSSNKGLEESAFKYRIFNECGEEINSLLSVETIKRETSYSLLGETLPTNINDGLEELISYLNIAINKLKSFHLNEQCELHYHHIIHAILFRARELIESINILTKNNYYIQSICLIRNLYELTLNFYIIWLSPQKNSSLFQFANTFSTSEWEKAVNMIVEKLVKNSSNLDNIKKIKQSHLYEYKLANKVIEKARIHPLGEAFYNNVYSFLSEITHDCFSVNARYKNTLELGNDKIYNEDIIQRILRITDLCIANIYSPAMKDIGVNNKD